MRGVGRCSNVYSRRTTERTKRSRGPWPALACAAIRGPTKHGEIFCHDFEVRGSTGFDSNSALFVYSSSLVLNGSSGIAMPVSVTDEENGKG